MLYSNYRIKIVICYQNRSNKNTKQQMAASSQHADLRPLTGVPSDLLRPFCFLITPLLVMSHQFQSHCPIAH